ncbi:hypothetical protein E3G69_000055 [Mycobacteroides abscessus]|nr:ImmA/IrrE family metallo-endopeptidase [Mycobacteroides abscessus]MBE5462794.1 hypothetical protein [Mycobacteroides abscessus]QOF41045.1 hypothetical protein E3G69_000055 [Mycobacteroides abscessus]QOF45744.1 hypothetical protein E3G70_000054 [Mycobacteroides abscessus]
MARTWVCWARISIARLSSIGSRRQAQVFVIVEDFCDPEVDAVTLRASQHHPHVVYVNATLPPDRMRMTLAHELGHLVMDAMTLVSPAATASGVGADA